MRYGTQCACTACVLGSCLIRQAGRQAGRQGAHHPLTGAYLAGVRLAPIPESLLRKEQGAHLPGALVLDAHLPVVREGEGADDDTAHLGGDSPPGEDVWLLRLPPLQPAVSHALCDHLAGHRGCEVHHRLRRCTRSLRSKSVGGFACLFWVSDTGGSFVCFHVLVRNTGREWLA